MTSLLLRHEMKVHQVAYVLLRQHLLIKREQCAEAFALDVCNLAAFDFADR